MTQIPIRLLLPNSDSSKYAYIVPVTSYNGGDKSAKNCLIKDTTRKF